MGEFNDRRAEAPIRTTVLGRKLPASYSPTDFPGGRYTATVLMPGGGNHSQHSSMEEAMDWVKTHAATTARNIQDIRGRHIDGAPIPSVFSIRHSTRKYPIASGTVIATPREGGSSHEITYGFDTQPVVHEGELDKRVTAADATQKRFLHGK